MTKKIICILFFVSLLIFPSQADEVFLSLKKSKVFVRYGPSFESDIKYVYRKINLPIKQIDKKENFRRIIDFKKNSGWIHASQLRKGKSFITLQNKILFSKPTKFSKPIIKIAKGRLLIVSKCKIKWCKVKTESHIGWVRNNYVWGM